MMGDKRIGRIKDEINIVLNAMGGKDKKLIRTYLNGFLWGIDYSKPLSYENYVTLNQFITEKLEGNDGS